MIFDLIRQKSTTRSNDQNKNAFQNTQKLFRLHGYSGHDGHFSRHRVSHIQHQIPKAQVRFFFIIYTVEILF